MIKTKRGSVIGTRVEPLSVTIPDACTMTGLGRSKLYELLASGEIRSGKAGRRRLIPVDALREWVDSLAPSQNAGS